jgi:hypothetical protein
MPLLNTDTTCISDWVFTAIAGEKLDTILSVCLSRYSENVIVLCLSSLHPGMVKWGWEAAVKLVVIYGVYNDPS